MWEESPEYQRVYDLVYKWGREHHKLLDLKTEEEEKAHFGKRIKDFTWDEKRGYEDGFYNIETYFEVVIPHIIERAAEADLKCDDLKCDDFKCDDDYEVRYDDEY